MRILGILSVGGVLVAGEDEGGVVYTGRNVKKDIVLIGNSTR